MTTISLLLLALAAPQFAEGFSVQSSDTSHYALEVAVPHRESGTFTTSGELDLTELYRFSNVIGSRAGHHGSASVDLNGDGRDEIVTAASHPRSGWPTWWYVLGYDEKTDAYRIRWTSNFLQPIFNLTVAEKSDGPGYNIFLRFRSGDVSVYDGSTFEHIAYLEGASSWDHAGTMAVGDATNDGRQELAVVSLDEIRLYDTESLELRQIIPDTENGNGFGQWSQSSIVIAPVLGNGKNQIVTRIGRILQSDGEKYEDIWDYREVTGHAIGAVRVGNLGPDGNPKLIVFGIARVYVVDPIERKLVASIPAGHNTLRDAIIADCSGDGRLDIFATGHTTHCIDGRTFQEVWQKPISGAGLSAGEFEGNGRPMISLVTGTNSTANDFIHVFEASESPELRWRSDWYRGWISAVRGADFLGDESHQLIVGFRDVDYGWIDEHTWDPANYGVATFVVVDQHGEVAWSSRDESFDWYEFRPVMDVLPVRGHPHLPDGVLFGSAWDSYMPLVFHGSAGNTLDPRLWITDPRGYMQDGRTTTVRLADWTGDGVDNIIFSDGLLMVADVATGEVTQIPRPVVVGEVYTFEVGNFLSEDAIDLVAIYSVPWEATGLANDNSLLLEPGDGSPRRVLSGHNHDVSYYGLASVAIPDSKLRQLYVSTATGQIGRLNLETLRAEDLREVSPFPIMAIKAFDVTGDGIEELVFGDMATLGVYSLVEDRILWRAVIGGTVGLLNNIDVWRDATGHVFLAAGTTHKAIVYSSYSPTSVSPIAREVPELSLVTYPNPTQQASTVTIALNRPMHVTVRIFDALGREAVNLMNGWQSAEQITLEWDSSGLPSGVYFVVVETEAGRASSAVVVAR